MKNIKFFFITVLLFFWVENLFAEGQWIPFKTGNTDRDNIYGIAIEGDSIWCATNDGVIRWNKKDGTYIYFAARYGFSEFDATVYCIAIDHNGAKWVGKNDGILSFDNYVWRQYTSDNVDILGQIKQNYQNIGFWINKIIVSTDDKKFFHYQGEYSIGRQTLFQGYILSYDEHKWENLTTANVGGGSPFFSMAMDTINPNILWFSLYFADLYYYNLADSSLSEIYNNNNIYVDEIVSIGIDKNNLIWLGRNNNITTYDRKNIFTYSPETSGIQNIVKAIAVDKNNVKWFGSHLGITSFDESKWKTYTPDWWYFDQRLDNSDIINDLVFDNDGKLWAGTNKGLYRFDSTATDIKEIKELPVEISIKGNFPNPFNPSTSITYTLSSLGHANLCIYSLTGQRVRTLVSGNLTAGTHSIVWDGRDDSGKPVSSGIYLSRLQMGDKVAVGRMLLLK